MAAHAEVREERTAQLAITHAPVLHPPPSLPLCPCCSPTGGATAGVAVTALLSTLRSCSHLLPLTISAPLQPDWRRHVKRCFNSAARALEVISSPLHRLRVQLHLEAAKCDAAEDSLIKVGGTARRGVGAGKPSGGSNPL